MTPPGPLGSASRCGCVAIGVAIGDLLLDAAATSMHAKEKARPP